MSASGFDRNSFTARLVERAQQDPQFRQQLLSNPQQALEQAAGVQLPANANVRVVEEGQNEYYLVLPSQQSGAGGGVSEGALEAASGPYSSWGGGCVHC